MKKTTGVLAGFGMMLGLCGLFLYLIPPGLQNINLLLYSNTLWFGIAPGLMVGLLVAADGR